MIDEYPRDIYKQCLDGHKGPIKPEWFDELDDDRTRLLIVMRCQNCGFPTGPDDYATREEEDARARGEEPTRVPV